MAFNRLGLAAIAAWILTTGAMISAESRIPDASWPLLDGVTTLVIDALRRRAHSTHFNVDEAVAVVARLGATRAYFTHISHDLGHAETCARLPPGVELAYDGQVIEIDR